MKKSSRDVETKLPDPDNRPCFSKICNGNTNHSNILTIPKRFVKTHLPKTMPASSRAVLKGPSGDSWNITLYQQEGGNVTIGHGWKQFYQHHSLGDYEFLVFRHNGNMCFDVQVFDKTGSERKSNNVSVRRSTSREPAMEIEEEEEMDDINDTVKTEPEDETEEENPAPGSSSKPQQSNKGRRKSKTAEDFTSKFPHFKHCLIKSNVETPFQLTIPAFFAKSNLPEAKTEFTFRTTSKQMVTWEVSLICSETKKIFSKGWRSFAIDNELKRKDSCVFELVAPQEIRVHVFPC